MQNVDGDYDEIVEWLDNNPVEGVEFFMSHGIWDAANSMSLNVGLFSLEEDHYADGDCLVCAGSNGDFACYFERTKISVPTEAYTEIWHVEQPELTHLIRF